MCQFYLSFNTQNFNKLTDKELIDDAMMVIALIFDITFIVVISFFFKFHIDLLFTNSTTIENLDKKRTNMSLGNANVYKLILILV